MAQRQGGNVVFLRFFGGMLAGGVFFFLTVAVLGAIVDHSLNKITGPTASKPLVKPNEENLVVVDGEDEPSVIELSDLEASPEAATQTEVTQISVETEDGSIIVQLAPIESVEPEIEADAPQTEEASVSEVEIEDEIAEEDAPLPRQIVQRAGDDAAPSQSQPLADLERDNLEIDALVPDPNLAPEPSPIAVVDSGETPQKPQVIRGISALKEENATEDDEGAASSDRANQGFEIHRARLSATKDAQLGLLIDVGDAAALFDLQPRASFLTSTKDPIDPEILNSLRIEGHELFLTNPDDAQTALADLGGATGMIGYLIDPIHSLSMSKGAIEAFEKQLFDAGYASLRLENKSARTGLSQEDASDLSGVITHVLEGSYDRFSFARVMDLAALSAKNGKPVIVLLPSDPEIIALLNKWIEGPKALRVDLLPVSSILAPLE